MSEKYLIKVGAYLHQRVQCSRGFLEDNAYVGAQHLSSPAGLHRSEILARKLDASFGYDRTFRKQACDGHGGHGLAASRVAYEA